MFRRLVGFALVATLGISLAGCSSLPNNLGRAGGSRFGGHHPRQSDGSEAASRLNEEVTARGGELMVIARVR